MYKQFIVYRIFCILFVLFTWVGMTGCVDEDTSNGVEGQEGTITLRLFTEGVQARSAGESSYNENDIHGIDLYFYPQGNTSSDALLSHHVDVAAETTATVSVNLPVNVKDQLFANNAPCTVYAIVNRPTGTTEPDVKSVDNLQKMVVSTENFTSTTAQTDFVMQGQGDVTWDDNAKQASGNVSVKRVAAKIRLAIRVAESVTDSEDNRWTPNLNNIHGYITNGVKKAYIDGTLYDTDADRYFNISPTADFSNGRLFASDATGSTTEYPLSHALPFYSYPNEWQDGPQEEHRTYLTLIVPWRHEGETGTSYRPCYYQVPINVNGGKNLESNKYYQIHLDVNMLGSFVQEEPLELAGRYTVADWHTEDIPVDIHDYRYLVVNENDYVMNNEESITIPFFTSHQTDVVGVQMTYYRYNVAGTNGAETSRMITKEQNDRTRTVNGGQAVYECSIDGENNTLTFSHPLIAWEGRTNNGISTTDPNNVAYYVPANYAAYSRYEMEITIRHSDQKEGTQFEQTLKIVQYPGMYIMMEHNDGTNNKGYVFVNNSNSTNASLGGVNGLGGGSSNRNPNMYLINLTQLNVSDGYTIADPRSLVVNNNLNGTGSLSNTVVNQAWSSFAQVVPMEGGGRRRLLYYYPTDESSDKENCIAPQIRIASSYGVTSSLSRESARRRCASYQEYGYPAGRWRVPTKGEIRYIVNLSATEKIPILFNPGGTYWSAQGAIEVPANTTGSVIDASGTSHFVRCVYDEWYWKDKLPDNQRRTFTWGDAPKDSPQEPTGN